MTPSLSVVVPNYNHAHYLPVCLDALLAQSLQPQEIIVVDDGSTDESLSVIKSYRVKLIHLEKNRGPAYALNCGIDHARGDYLAFCAADDTVLPGFFEKAMGQLASYPSAALCTGDYITFPHPQEKKMGPSSRLLYPDELVYFCRHKGWYIPSQATLYKKSAVLHAGGFRAELMTLSDFYLNLQIGFQHPIIYLPELFSAYRIEPSSYSRAMRSQLQKRHQICTALMRRLSQESPMFQNRVRQSGILFHAGWFMLAYLLYTPRYYRYFIPALQTKMGV